MRRSTPGGPRPIPIGPTVDAWRAMTTAEREEFQVQVIDALSDPKSAMSEGRPHKKAKGRAIDVLGLHFGTLSRAIYLAEDLAVVSPGEEAFSPDVLAVLDVPQPEDDQRLAWSDLIGRLQEIVGSLEAKASRAEQAEAQAEQALLGTREAIVALLGARGISISGEVRARLDACHDVTTLQRWLLRATRAERVEDLFAGDAGGASSRE